jgi:hypothetical protein
VVILVLCITDNCIVFQNILSKSIFLFVTLIPAYYDVFLSFFFSFCSIGRWTGFGGVPSPASSLRIKLVNFENDHGKPLSCSTKYFDNFKKQPCCIKVVWIECLKRSVS